MSSKIYQCIEAIGNRIIEQKEFLTELDREIGDADHGINMARGFTEVLAVAEHPVLFTARLTCRPAKSAPARLLSRLKTGKRSSRL